MALTQFVQMAEKSLKYQLKVEEVFSAFSLLLQGGWSAKDVMGE